MFYTTDRFDGIFQRLCDEGKQGKISDMDLTRGGEFSYVRAGANVRTDETVPVAFFDRLFGSVLAGRADPLPFADLNATILLPDNGPQIRVHVCQARGIRRMCIRLQPAELPTPEGLCLPAHLVQLVATAKAGIVFVTGRTGSGKTTTLSALIEHRCRHYPVPARLLTLEDPLEYPLGVGTGWTVLSREVGVDVPTFQAGMVSAMRERPDTILIGETRDAAAATQVLSAGSSGNLFLTTMHTPSVVQTVTRFGGFFQDGERSGVLAQLADLAVVFVSQRLLPRADGQGMTPVFEVCTPNNAIRNFIRTGKPEAIHGDGAMNNDNCITFARSLETAEKNGLVERGRFRASSFLS